MATAKQVVERMRGICLALPGTTEGEHFGVTAFYVAKKLFATVGEKHGVLEISFGLEPDHAEALVKNDPRFTPYPRDKRGVVIEAAKVDDWKELEALLRESYALRKPAAKKKTPAKAAAPARRKRPS